MSAIAFKVKEKKTQRKRRKSETDSDKSFSFTEEFRKLSKSNNKNSDSISPNSKNNNSSNFNADSTRTSPKVAPNSSKNEHRDVSKSAEKQKKKPSKTRKLRDRKKKVKKVKKQETDDVEEFCFEEQITKEIEKLNHYYLATFSRVAEIISRESEALKEGRRKLEEDLGKCRQDILLGFDTERTLLELETKKLRKERKKFESMKKKLQQEYGTDAKIARLNVGGTYMDTLTSTLTKVEGSMLQAMFSGYHPILRDENGRAFIDRNPKIFELVLDYLRTGTMPAVKEPTVKKAFENELIYFGLIDVRYFNYDTDWDENGLFFYVNSMNRLSEITITSTTKSNINDLDILTRQAQVWQIEGKSCALNLDLGTIGELSLSYYTIRHRSDFSETALRNWQVYGSKDGSGWVLLSDHVDDTSLSEQPLSVASWPISTSEFYRFYKLQLTGECSGHYWFFNLSNIEFYGTLKIEH